MSQEIVFKEDEGKQGYRSCRIYGRFESEICVCHDVYRISNQLYRLIAQVNGENERGILNVDTQVLLRNAYY